MSRAEEIALTFTCAGETMTGVIHRPERPLSRGVVIVVGGPQYRIGSHRQYVLLARELAAAGYPVLRFDCRGMGDSDGEFRGFENIEDDIRAAVDTLFERAGGLRDVALWGLCDGASAIAFYAGTDDRVNSIILVNPWVRDEVTLAQAQIRHHYARRFFSGRFWADLFAGKVDIGKSAREFVSAAMTVVFRRPDGAKPGGGKPEAHPGRRDNPHSLPERVGQSIAGFRGRVLIILSGNDMTAREFDGAVLQGQEIFHEEKPQGVVVKRLSKANHTYSTGEWRQRVHHWSMEWLTGT